MLELFFIFVWLPRRIGRLARERGRSALWWSLFAIMMWVGLEVAAGVVLGLVSELLGLGQQAGSGTFVVVVIYIVALLSGAVGAEIVRRILITYPVAVRTEGKPVGIQ
ncbi:MAG TPA: hypothetical protein VFD58_36790 [Blastocatellia bacterium]|nr:hypothetical protein [Blastocatellia bacterium]